MFRIDSDAATVSLPTPAAVGSTVGYFTDGNPGTGTLATVVSADWLNAVQEEISGAITNAGLTLDKTSQSQLRQAMNYAKITSVSSADLTIATADLFQVVLMTTGNTNRTVNLPAAASNTNRRLKIKKIDSGTGTVTIDPNSTELIEGASTFILTFQNECADIVCNGTAWYVENYHYEKNIQAVATLVSGSATIGTSATEIVFDTAVEDTKSCFSTVTGRFTAKKAGYYMCSYNFQVSTGGSGPNFIDLYMLKNGAGSRLAKAGPGTGLATNSTYTYAGSRRIFLAVGDYVSCFGIVGANTVTLVAGSSTDERSMFNVTAL